MSVSFFGLILIGLVIVLVLAAVAGIVMAIVFATRRPVESGSNPNLAPCPDCQKLVSIHAPTCPSCGRPLKFA